MSSTSASATISVMDNIFAIHGLLKSIVSDSRIQFTSVQFKEYCKSRAIEHILSPPYPPLSHGQADKYKKGGRNGRINKTIPYHIQAQGSTEFHLQKY